LFQIAGKSLLEYNLDLIAKFAVTSPVEEVLIPVQYQAEKIIDFVSKLSYPFRIECVDPESIGENCFLGTADAVWKLSPQLSRTDAVVILSGDIMSNFSLSHLVDAYYKNKKDHDALGTLGLTSLPVNDALGKYGVIEVDDAQSSLPQIRAFYEKPLTFEVLPSSAIHGSHRAHRVIINPSFYVFATDLLSRENDGIDFGAHIFPHWRESFQSDLYGVMLDGYWNDVGSPDQVKLAAMDILDGKIAVKKDMEYQRTIFCLLGRGTGAENAFLFNTLLSEGYMLKPYAYIYHSLLGKQCKVGERTGIVHSVLGDNVRVGDDVHLDNVVVAPGESIPDATNLSHVVVYDNHTWRATERSHAMVPDLSIGQTTKTF